MKKQTNRKLTLDHETILKLTRGGEDTQTSMPPGADYTDKITCTSHTCTWGCPPAV